MGWGVCLCVWVGVFTSVGVCFIYFQLSVASTLSLPKLLAHSCKCSHSKNALNFKSSCFTGGPLLRTI